MRDTKGQGNSNFYVINAHKGKKRKLLTEPASPMEFASQPGGSSSSSHQFAQTQQNLENQLHSLNITANTHHGSSSIQVNGSTKELPIKLSGNRMSITKNGSTGNTQIHFNSLSISNTKGGPK